MCSDPSKPGDSPARPVGAIMRALWICVGAVSLALGAVGVILPLLPTTPFVLLAAFAFARSAPRLRAWLAGNRIFGPIIVDWEQSGVIAPKYKVIACTVMAAVLLGSIIGGLAWGLIAIQAVCMAGAAAYVLSRPSGAGR
ncbi:YbaN family protein [Roseovarius dicentrarchi]|uniref:YbaN family protein n=1 Tax=Roseovarius dicentrarchi TaxID=2250573 RepID=UPI001EF153C5|nr:YbaN family protein [Roseovarius dicentrarchi]